MTEISNITITGELFIRLQPLLQTAAQMKHFRGEKKGSFESIHHNHFANGESYAVSL